MEKRVFELFEGKELYLVGGVVRDRLLGKETNDLDFATNLLPDEIEKVLNDQGYKTYDIGKAFGTISFMLDGNKVEITTYRRNEKYTRDNRHPVVEWGKTIADDLVRRDFTMNALAMDRDGKVVDLFRGQEDLKNGVLDTPMDAREIFSDDPLRVLRAVRFRSRFGFQYSEQVQKALASEGYRVMFLSRERVVDEMNKILVGDYVAEALQDLMRFRIFNYFLPELTVLDGEDQLSQYHSKDVWSHVCGVVENIPADPVLRWAALMHDVAKPYTKTFDTKVHFYRHEELGALMTSSILTRLGLPKKMIEDVTFLVRNHMRTNLYERSWSDSAVRRFVVEVGLYLEKLLALSKADITSHNPGRVQEHLDEIADLERRIEEQRSYVELKCPVDGKTIMEYFNLAPGREIGRLKDLVMEALKDGSLQLGEDKSVYLKYVEQRRV